MAACVVVTGAGGAVGRGVVLALARRDANVLALDIDAAALERLEGEVPSAGGSLRTAVCDVRDGECLRSACAGGQASLGPIVGFFNNAGIEGPIKPVRELSEADLLAVYGTNVIGVVLGMKTAIDLMLGHGGGGRILNMASGAGLRGTANMGAYVASKHAVVGLTRCAALELAPVGIAVNALCPGCIDTPMLRRIEKALGGSGEEQLFVPSIPAGRYADVSEIAETAAWLLLEAPLFLTGAALPIDGGWAAQ